MGKIYRFHAEGGNGEDWFESSEMHSNSIDQIDDPGRAKKEITANRILENSFRKINIEVMHSNICEILNNYKGELIEHYKQNFKGIHNVGIVQKLKNKLSIEEIAEVLDISEVQVEVILK